MISLDHFRGLKNHKYLKKVFPISIAYGFYSWGWGLTTPIFAILINSITNDLFITGLVIAVWGIVGLVLDIPFGVLCDKWNVKKIMQGCLFGYIFLTIGYTLATNTWQIFTIRLIHSIFGALLWVAIWTYLFRNMKRDHTGEEIGFFSVFYDFAATIAPLVGGVIATMSFFLPFYLLSAFCAISLIIVTFMVKDLNGCQTKPFFYLLKHELADFKKIGVPTLRWFIFLTIVSYSIVAVIASFLPILLYEAGVSYGYIGLVVAIGILPAVLLEIPLGRYVDHKQRDIVAIIGLLGLGLSLVPMVFSLNLSVVIVSIAFYGIMSALVLILVNTIASNLAPKREKGAFSGTTTWFKDVGNFVGPILGGLAFKLIGTSWTMAILAAICVVSVPLFIMARKMTV